MTATETLTEPVETGGRRPGRPARRAALSGLSEAAEPMLLSAAAPNPAETFLAAWLAGEIEVGRPNYIVTGTLSPEGFSHRATGRKTVLGNDWCWVSSKTPAIKSFGAIVAEDATEKNADLKLRIRLTDAGRLAAQSA